MYIHVNIRKGFGFAKKNFLLVNLNSVFQQDSTAEAIKIKNLTVLDQPITDQPIDFSWLFYAATMTRSRNNMKF